RIARQGKANIAAISECTTSRPAPSWLDSNCPVILVRASYPRFLAAFANAVTREGLREWRQGARGHAPRCRQEQLVFHRTQCSESQQQCSFRRPARREHHRIVLETGLCVSRRSPAQPFADCARGCNSRGRTRGAVLLPLEMRQAS